MIIVTFVHLFFLSRKLPMFSAKLFVFWVNLLAYCKLTKLPAFLEIY